MFSETSKSENTRRSILIAAAKLIAQFGFDATVLSDIAHETKLSKGTLYYYYATKESLLRDVADAHFGGISDIILEWLENSHSSMLPEHRLSVLLDSLICDYERSRLHVALLSEASRDGSLLREQVAQKYHEWSVMLEVASLRLCSMSTNSFFISPTTFFILVDGCMLKSSLGLNVDASEVLQQCAFEKL